MYKRQEEELGDDETGNTSATESEDGEEEESPYVPAETVTPENGGSTTSEVSVVGFYREGRYVDYYAEHESDDVKLPEILISGDQITSATAPYEIAASYEGQDNVLVMSDEGTLVYTVNVAQTGLYALEPVSYTHLQIVITHSPYDRIINDTEQLIREHDILGCDYIGLGSMPAYARKDRAGLEAFLSVIQAPAEKIRAAGKRFGYHNHAMEFRKMEGQLIFDRILEKLPADMLGIILDTYWVQPVSYTHLDVYKRQD